MKERLKVGDRVKLNPNKRGSACLIHSDSESCMHYGKAYTIIAEGTCGGAIYHTLSLGGKMEWFVYARELMRVGSKIK